MSTALEVIKGLPKNEAIKASADRRGLVVEKVSWEDCARDKSSVWGPCISDVTLRVEQANMPIIRSQNFTDVTWDLPLGEIKLVVGNEATATPSPPVPLVVTLKEYLANLHKYLSYPSRWKDGHVSLLKDSDEEEHAVVSAQSCFLPMDSKKDEEVSFNPCVFTYGTGAGEHPKVLYIVATSHGTSAQFKESADKDWGSRGSLLYFNHNGKRASLCARRIEDDRRDRGVPEQGPMTKDEASRNMIMLIQVPLVGLQVAYRSKAMFDFGPAMPYADDSSSSRVEHASPVKAGFSFGAPPKGPAGPEMNDCSADGNEDMDMDEQTMSHAIVSVGAVEGKYEELGYKNLRRDKRYPVRVTMQYYKITNGSITDEHVGEVSRQILEAMNKGVAFGSLVLPTDSGRSTEHTTSSVVSIPPWWDMYWATFHEMYTCAKEEAARHFFTGDTTSEYLEEATGAWKGMQSCSNALYRRGASIRKKNEKKRVSNLFSSSSFGPT